MVISNLKAQNRLTRLCDDNALDGILCRFCRKKIYPRPSRLYPHRKEPPTPVTEYEYVKNGEREFFIHKECIRKEVRT